MITSIAPSTVDSPAWRPLLDLKESADYLRVSARLVQKLVAARRLRPSRIGRRLIFKRAELDRYVDLQTALS